NSGSTAQPASATTATNTDTSLASMYSPEAPYQTVFILGVTDQQAEVITYARENGLIDLTMRSSAVQKDDAGNIVKADQGQDRQGEGRLYARIANLTHT